MGFFSRLKKSLTKTRTEFVENVSGVFAEHDKIDDDFYDDLEEVLISGDIGVETTENILEDLRSKIKANHIKSPADCQKLLVDSLRDQMKVDDSRYAFEKQKSVLMIIGVNGVGKTTSIGKLACRYKKEGKKVILAAADTYRAAANEQLTEWSQRAGVQLISGSEGADPASVVFDACQAAKARNADMLIVDTAGRLHNKKNLMKELYKLYQVIEKEYPDAYQETLLVLDGTTGQNALQQAHDFFEAANVSGIILTKLDGTAKGGIAIAISSEYGIPVKFIGVGEGIDDLQKFDADEYINALFDLKKDGEEDDE
ncbi:MAG: signal recognition particle-docking protein FtsY [Lachnospiraceae bacterium]|nr:signal recognition particle-docking protein FtsY [Lachnospiraceae bacterium]